MSSGFLPNRWQRYKIIFESRTKEKEKCFITEKYVLIIPMIYIDYCRISEVLLRIFSVFLNISCRICEARVHSGIYCHPAPPLNKGKVAEWQ